MFCGPTICHNSTSDCDVVFGVKNHTVSCKLLEYGYLAVCSQHRLDIILLCNDLGNFVTVIYS